MYNEDKQITFKTSMLKSSLCDYLDGYTVVYIYIYIYISSANTTIDIALMNHKNTAQQLFNISEDIYKSFYHIVFLEVCRAYQIIPRGLFISNKPCIGKPSDMCEKILN